MAKQRKGIPKRLRYLVFKRDDFRCRYCGATPPGVVLHLDHIVPVSKGGPDTFENLITSCADCNLGKRDDNLLQELIDEASAAVYSPHFLRVWNAYHGIADLDVEPSKDEGN